MKRRLYRVPMIGHFSRNDNKSKKSTTAVRVLDNELTLKKVFHGSL
jgi:hypothetical protein